MTIPAGQNSVTYNLKSINDVVYETDEIIQFTSNTITGGTLANSSAIDLTLKSDELIPKIGHGLYAVAKFEKISRIKANSITVDYDVNFNKFGLDDGDSHDLSGVDIPVAIEEFVNLLEDIPNKQDIIE